MEFTAERMTLERLPDAMSYLLGEIADIKAILRNRPESEKTEDIRLNGDKELAQYLHCSVQTVQMLKRRGQISFHRMGRRCYYLSSEIDRDLAVASHKLNKK